MKTIGWIGGMSWESSALYDRIINEETKRRLGGHHNAPSVMVTIDFADADRMMHLSACAPSPPRACMRGRLSILLSPRPAERFPVRLLPREREPARRKRLEPGPPVRSRPPAS